jgi:hypothetical protein
MRLDTDRPSSPALHAYGAEAALGVPDSFDGTNAREWAAEFTPARIPYVGFALCLLQILPGLLPESRHAFTNPVHLDV